MSKRPFSCSDRAVIPKLQKLYARGKFTDVTFEAADGIKISAHRAVIALWSPVLEALLESSLANEGDNSAVKLGDMDGCTLKLLLEFMYGCELILPKENSKKQCLALLETAHKYNICELVQESDRLLSVMEVEEESLLQVLKVVDRVGAHETKHTMLRHLLKFMDGTKGRRLVKQMLKSSDNHDKVLAGEIFDCLWQVRSNARVP